MPINNVKELPNLISQLIDEHEKYSKKTQELKNQIDAHNELLEKQKTLILSALSDYDINDEEMLAQKPEIRNLLRDYMVIRKKLKNIDTSFNKFRSDTDERLEKIRKDIKHIEDYVTNYGNVDLSDDLEIEVSSLAQSIDVFMRNRIKDSIESITTSIKRSLEGDRNAIPDVLEKTINEAIIEKLEEIIMPYEESAYKLTHNEISQEAFIESLKKRALVEQLRSKIIMDITHSINQRNINDSSIPTDLRKAIDNLIRDQVSYALLSQDKNKFDRS